MGFRTPRPAVAGYALSAVLVVVHVLGIGGPEIQIAIFKGFAPLLGALLAGTAWQAWYLARRAGQDAARRHLFLTGCAWSALALSAVVQFVHLVAAGDLSLTPDSPLVGLLDLMVPAFLIPALLTIPVRNRWSASRLRVGLDMATVMTAGAVFVWYFLSGPSASVPELVLTIAPLVAIFAISRLWIGGVAEVSRRAMHWALACGAGQMTIAAVQPLLAGGEHLHLLLAAKYVVLVTVFASNVAHARRAVEGEEVLEVSARRPASLLPYLAIAAVDLLLVEALARNGLDRSAWVVLGGALLLTGIVVTRQIVGLRDNSRLVLRVDAGMAAVRVAVGRERVLSDLGTALLRTTDPAEVHRLAAEAAGTLLADHPGARVTVVAAAPGHEWWTVVQAIGPGAEDLLGTEQPGSSMPPELLTRLRAGETVAAPGCLGEDGTGPAATMMPLLSGERFFGVMTVAAPADLPDDLVHALHTLRTQVALALGSVALTAELTLRALHDPLTGLGNRALLRERLTGALTRSRRTGSPAGVLMLDLNGFKPVNDTYGHDVGDSLLQVVAERLRTCVRTEDTVARLGGDEFVVITEDLRDKVDAVLVAERIIAVLNEPVTIGGHELRTPVSIGIALSRAGDSPDDVLRYADSAMYSAKRAGGGRFHLYGVFPQLQS
ncbi:MAG TPA: GGDEF domain-containing protein [Actinoplanes sp.]|nr:GGDEF domain-containing protein [Actinoplanes sp.]